MIIKHKLVFTGLIACVAFGLFWQCTKQKVTSVSDTIIVGTNPEYPPFTFVKNDELIGFDIDLIKIIGQRLGKKLEFKSLSFDALIPAAQLGSVHVIAAGMTPNPERAKRLLFTKPHAVGDPLCIVTLAKKPVIQNVDELKNKEVAVPEGYTADFYISNFHDIHLTRLATMTEAFLALTSGRVDALVAAEGAIKPFFEQQGHNDFRVTIIPGTFDSYALGISKKYPDLLVPIQHVLDQLQHDGTIKKLKEKWKMAQ